MLSSEPSGRCRSRAARPLRGSRPSAGSGGMRGAMGPVLLQVAARALARPFSGPSACMAERPETKSIIVTQAVHDYAVAHGTPPDDVQQSLIEATAGARAAREMQIAPEQGAFMTLLTRLVGARLAVEVGTFTGYSSLCIARGPGRRRAAAVLRRERGVDRASPGEHWAQAGVDDRIELRIGPAADTLRALPARSADRPRVHRRRQARLPHLLRRDRPAAPSGRAGAASTTCSGAATWSPTATSRRRHGGDPGLQRPRRGRPAGRAS